MLFNIIGTIIFVTVSFIVPIDKIIISYSRDLPAAQIANLHTLFNVATSILLFPFSRKLADLSFKIIPGIDKEQEEMSLQYINKNIVKDAPATFTDVKAEIRRMLEIVSQNYENSVSLLKNFDEEKYDEIFRRLAFTDKTFEELKEINEVIEKMFSSALGEIDRDERISFMRSSNELVQKDATQFRNNHMLRMREKICDPESGLLYEKTLAAMERISSYISNAGKLAI